MLTSLLIVSGQGASLTINFAAPELVTLKDIQGLDAGKATLSSAPFAQLGGAQFFSGRREPRNIKISLGYGQAAVNAGYTIEDLRGLLYKCFMPASTVGLRFSRTVNPLLHIDDGVGPVQNLEIIGIVESMETAVFTKDPQVNVSIMCYDPDFIDDGFPGSIDANTISDLSDTSTWNFAAYDGSSNGPVRLIMNVDRTLTEFTIYHKPPNGVIQSMDVSASFIAGDQVDISTSPGSKWARLTRAGTTSSILYAVSPQSTWIAMQPGVDNHVRVYATGAGIAYNLSYSNRYGGL